MKHTVAVLFLFISAFAFAQTHIDWKQQAIKDSLTADSLMKEMERQIQEMEKQTQDMMKQMEKETGKKMAVFNDTAYVDSLRKANASFSFAGTWRGSFENEKVTFMFFADSTWRGRAEKKSSDEIAGTWHATSDSLFLIGKEIKDGSAQNPNKKTEKIYVPYIPYSSKEVWLFIPFIEEKVILKKVQ